MPASMAAASGVKRNCPGPIEISVSVVVVDRCGYLATGWVAGKCRLKWGAAGSASTPEREGDRHQDPGGHGVIALPRGRETPALDGVDRRLVEPR